MARHAGGWVKLHRKVLANEFFDDASALAIWTLLLMWANRKDGQTLVKRQALIVKRGQVVTSRREIARKLKLDPHLVGRRLDDMEKLSMVTQQVTHHGNLISIVKYDDYQRDDSETTQRLQHERPTHDSGMTHRRPDSGEGEKREEELRNHHSACAREAKQLEATGILSLALGAMSRGLQDDLARAYIGERGWSAIHKRYATFEEFERTYAVARRKSSPTIVEGQFRNAIASVLTDESSAH